MSKSINWTLGSTKVFTATEIGDVLTVNGFKDNDFVMTKNTAGQLVLTDAIGGTIKISNWSSSTLKSIKFTAGGYSKSLAKSVINTQLFNTLTLANEAGGQLVYDSGTVSGSSLTLPFLKIRTSSSTRLQIQRIASASPTAGAASMKICLWWETTCCSGTGILRRAKTLPGRL